ncbi:hypothetical protein HMPREF0513_00066 [Limosilactobacillus fermentum 28-3-CHN]|uniref:Uncharacterized protein n=1 Tax=Limosilactobacillus fermentum 28-3-CHN TaxID=575599 RepID=D0DR52_LIMFE|nr:hypothetical protein HMPREF0513_00066 [Limosilactobacillus fermentum 28-3-CHN]
MIEVEEDTLTKRIEEIKKHARFTSRTNFEER